MNTTRSNKLIISMFILPALLFYLGVSTFPLLSSLVLSFFNWNVAGLNGFIGLKNYIQLFSTDTIFLGACLNTFYATFLCLAIQVPFAMLLAFLLRKNIALKNVFKISFFVPNMVSTASIGILWIFILHPEFGMLNSLLKSVGLGALTHVWLGESDTALTFVILALCWQYIGYHMIIYLCAMQNIPSSINEAASIDGANAWQVFWKITLPMIAPIIKVDAVLIATGSLRIFDVVFIMTGGGPNHASEMIATHLYTRSFKGMQFGYGSAMSVILMVMCVGITLIIDQMFKKAENNL